MIAISIGNGSGDAQGSERGLEYDTMSPLYAEFVEHFEKGEISDAFRLKCATAVFEKTSRYDAAIARFLSGGDGLALDLTKFQDLRYGENPQQSATFYVRSGFRAYRRAVEVADDPRLLGLLPDTAASWLPLIGARRA